MRQFKCPGCQSPVSVPQDAKSAICGKCGKVITIRPKQSTPPPPIGPEQNSTAESQWLVLDEAGNQYGPFDVAFMQECIRKSRVVASTRVKHPVFTKDEWRPASSVDQFKGNFVSLAVDLTRPADSTKRVNIGGYLDLFDVGMKRNITPFLIRVIWCLALSLFVLLAIVDVGFMMYWFASLFTREELRVPIQDGGLPIAIIASVIFWSFIWIWKALALLSIRIALEFIVVVFQIEANTRKLSNRQAIAS